MSVTWMCDRTKVDPQVANDVDATLGPLPGIWIAHEGQRVNAAQAADYQRGRTPFASSADLMASDPKASIVNAAQVVTEAKPGQSPHNPTALSSLALAVDVYLLLDGAPNWDYTRPEWHAMIAAVRASPRLHSGADFPAPDQDHIEAYRYAHATTAGPSVIAQLETLGVWNTAAV